MPLAISNLSSHKELEEPGGRATLALPQLSRHSPVGSPKKCMQPSWSCWAPGRGPGTSLSSYQPPAGVLPLLRIQRPFDAPSFPRRAPAKLDERVAAPMLKALQKLQTFISLTSLEAPGTPCGPPGRGTRNQDPRKFPFDRAGQQNCCAHG